MSVIVEVPVTMSGVVPFGPPGDAGPGPHPLMIQRDDGIRRELIGLATLKSDADGVTIACEVDAATANALVFGSVHLVGVDLYGGDIVDGTLDGWSFSSAIASRRCVQAAVQRSGWDDLPLADRERPWDSAAADKRIAQRCGVDRAGVDASGADWDCYAAAHLYRDDDADPHTKGAYKMLLTDEIDGQRRIVPRAVFSAAGVLQGAMGGIDAPHDAVVGMREVIGDLYERMADAWDDDSLRAPWDDDPGPDLD